MLRIGCFLAAAAAALAAVAPARAGEGAAPANAWQRFHDKASKGEPVTVAFFGGSLTWGANASEPNRTSYRGYMGQYLLDKYPRTQIRLIDAAVGGTGSDLGMYRLDRDVLAYKPDLVFVDWSINDDVVSDTPGPAKFYETSLRRLLKADIAVMQAMLPVKWILGKSFKPEGQPRANQYVGLAKTYNTPWVDVTPYVQAKTSAEGGPTLDECWPIEGTHPVDIGYRLYFEAVRDAFEKALENPPTATVPAEPVYGEYTKIVRHRLGDAANLPEGWAPKITFRTSMWYDGLTSRWMDDPVAALPLAAAREGKGVKMDFEGTTVGMFGEMDGDTFSAQVKIDGNLVMTPGKEPTDTWALNSQRFGGGRLFFWRRLASDLAPGKHTLEIIPIVKEDQKKGDLRIESICFAQ